ncbi:hypothetical protein QTN47_04740 [Danxiaibacter flavus]|uniref:Beta-lactamase-inhibitor-like PepSY-like domain-containing protein n=1 Tax=Danxiaibacter flavus TaxID=3049108 RepID=A0ABV3ZAB6_9BACT|nr:hypothetical protein QNM32_04740 [Chitinophagaceae bacterium DXS]
MKKLLLLSATMISSAIAFAQNDIVITGTKKVTEELAPKAVVDSLHKRFPDAKAVEYFQVDSNVVKRGWTVTEEDNLDPGSSIDRYTISFKRDNMKYYGLYKADGTLIMSKMQETDAALPDAVKATLKKMAGEDYKGWKLQSKTYFHQVNYDKSKSYYEIVATKGDEKKKVYLTPDGTVTKVK